MGKRFSAKCGHLTRKIMAGKDLSGSSLDLAIDIICSSSSEWAHELGRKLVRHEKLTDYEKHLMLEVLLLHAKLGAM